MLPRIDLIKENKTMKITTKLSKISLTFFFFFLNMLKGLKHFLCSWFFF